MHFTSLIKSSIFVIIVIKLQLSESSHHIEIITAKKLEFNKQKVVLKFSKAVTCILYVLFMLFSNVTLKQFRAKIMIFTQICHFSAKNYTQYVLRITYA